MVGLTSITFRQLSAHDIIAHAARAGLEGIEWGSDVHVPPQDIENARRIGDATREAGLCVTSYGTYYRLDGEGFSDHLAAARALGAPMLRLWAGHLGSADTSSEQRRRWVEDARRCADMAADAGLFVAFEYHPVTLTDDSDSAVLLMQEIDHPACRLYWQPDFKKTPAARIRGLMAARPYLSAVHVFHWMPDGTRLPLSEGAARWKEWVGLVPKMRELPCLLEFLPENDPALLVRESRTLREIFSLPCTEIS